MRLKADYFEAALRAEHSKNRQRDWLADVVNRLSGCPVRKCYEVQYWNHPDLEQHLRAQGYFACFQTTDRTGHPLYVMISRSHTNQVIDQDQIAAELISDEIVFEKFGEYYAQRGNKRGPGTFATLKFRTHWYMLSVCGHLKPYYRLVTQQRRSETSEPPTYEELKLLRAARVRGAGLTTNK